MSKEGLVQILVRNAQSLQNVERFGYSDPYVIFELEGEWVYSRDRKKRYVQLVTVHQVKLLP